MKEKDPKCYPFFLGALSCTCIVFFPVGTPYFYILISWLPHNSMCSINYFFCVFFGKFQDYIYQNIHIVFCLGISDLKRIVKIFMLGLILNFDLFEIHLLPYLTKTLLKSECVVLDLTHIAIGILVF